jgi:DNA-binding CsgD family transcriptional regulator
MDCRMLNLSDYDRVVSQIYDAALVPAQWDIALTSMISLFGPREWEVAMVLWERIDPPMGRFIGAAGVHDLARTAYLDFFAGQQDWSRRGHEMPVGCVYHTDEIISRDAFRETPFYQNFLKPWGFEVAVIGNLDRHDKDHMGLICPGPPGSDPGDLFEAIQRLTPHFQRAARISRRIGEADLRAAAATDLLNTSPYCVMALGAGLELLMANRRAEKLIDGDVGYALFHNQLKPDDPAIFKQLQAMAAGTSEERSITFGATGAKGQRLLLSALAVNPEQSGQFANRASGTALMIVGGQRIGVSENEIEALQHGFNLTAAEARLAAFLIEGSGVRGYADSRGVSQEAGKYLLKGIYAKTGLSNQTELVALLREAPLGWGTPLSDHRR